MPVQRVMGPAHVVNMVDAAVKHAIGRRGVAHLTIPKDIQDWTGHDDKRSMANVPRHSGDGLAPAEPMPPEEQFEGCLIPAGHKTLKELAVADAAHLGRRVADAVQDQG